MLSVESVLAVRTCNVYNEFWNGFHFSDILLLQIVFFSCQSYFCKVLFWFCCSWRWDAHTISTSNSNRIKALSWHFITYVKSACCHLLLLRCLLPCHPYVLLCPAISLCSPSHTPQPLCIHHALAASSLPLICLPMREKHSVSHLFILQGPPSEASALLLSHTVSASLLWNSFLLAFKEFTEFFHASAIITC